MQKMKKILVSAVAALALQMPVLGQTYPDGVIDKTVAVVGNEMISISQIEQEVQIMRAQGMASDRNIRCELL